ncbi:MAG TPA: ATP synthase F1 subunit epsilon [Dehalococcoidia bacterium]|nr:ATP synthase F1 subunit epsilon [Dehalococcoidia bacterium]
MILEIVTTEETIYSGEADIVIAPGVEGQLGILPRHAPLLTAVANGDVVVRIGTTEETIPVTGGFLEVLNNKVTILA